MYIFAVLQILLTLKKLLTNKEIHAILKVSVVRNYRIRPLYPAGPMCCKCPSISGVRLTVIFAKLKSEAMVENATRLRDLRKTGNRKVHEIHEVSLAVLRIVGKNHGNGLCLIPELGIKRRKKIMRTNHMPAVSQVPVSASPSFSVRTKLKTGLILASI